MFQQIIFFHLDFFEKTNDLSLKNYETSPKMKNTVQGGEYIPETFSSAEALPHAGQTFSFTIIIIRSDKSDCRSAI